MEPDPELNEIIYHRRGHDTDSSIYYNSKRYKEHFCDGNFDSQNPTYEDKFQVDRKKLERLILGKHDYAEHIEDFFDSIMEETNTLIDWPRRLKIGAKTKKDPYMRIHGQPSNVKKAKRKVLSILDPQKSTTIMKMDICYTCHSHIIGKGGQTIQQVMEDTGCHIHLPDSNRSNPYEKSNQVSITGNIMGVELARQKLRLLVPVKFSFEFPAVIPVRISPHPISKIIELVQERCNVRVILRKGPKLFYDVIIVKGTEKELEKTEMATRVLMQHLCNSLEGKVPVQMTMEISPQHHSEVRGLNSCNLKEIMVQTSTIIIFPDAQDPNLSPIKKSTVTISGNIHNVYLARQRLVGSLPLVLMLSVSEEQDIGIERCNSIMELLNVEISVRFKPKYGSYSVHIKGQERNAGELYKSIQMLLNSKEPPVQAEIPQSYFGQGSLLKSTGMDGKNVLQEVSKSPASFLENSAIIGSSDSLGWAFPTKTKSQTPVNIPQDVEKLNSLTLELGENGQLEQGNSKEPSLGSGSLHLAIDYSNFCNNHNFKVNSPGSSYVSSISSPIRSPMASPRSGSINLQGIDSGYGDTCESDSSRGVSRNSIMECENQVEKLGDEQFRVFLSDYGDKQALAMKAMKDVPDASKLRVPTTNWSGFGFSQSMPESVLKYCALQSQMESLKEVDHNKELSKLLANTSEDNPDNILPLYSPSMTTDGVTGLVRINDIADVFSLLARIGMTRYAYLFTSQEVDIVTFTTLNDNDLRLLGIPTHTARQKILRAIAELRKEYYFNSDADPHAERKAKISTNL